MELWEGVPHRDIELAKGLEHFYEESLRALTHVAKSGCGSSSLEVFKKLSGHDPGQPALGGPACTGVLDQTVESFRL